MVNIHVNDNNNNNIRINVPGINNTVSTQSSNPNNNVSSTIGNETFYNGLAKEWAISDKLVQGIDYSAKHYAQEAKQDVGQIVSNMTEGSNITIAKEGWTITIGTKTFEFEQGIASDTWVIAHNLDKYPSVTLVDSTETEFFAEVEYNDKNNCTIYLNGATKGKAYLN